MGLQRVGHDLSDFTFFLSRKLEIPREHFTQRWAQKRNGMDLTEAEDIKRSGKNTQKNYAKRSS